MAHEERRHARTASLASCDLGGQGTRQHRLGDRGESRRVRRWRASLGAAHSRRSRGGDSAPDERRSRVRRRRGRLRRLWGAREVHDRERRDGTACEESTRNPDTRRHAKHPDARDLSQAVFILSLQSRSDCIGRAVPVCTPMPPPLRDGELYAAQPRVDWASLLRRTFEFDVKTCPLCAGRLEVRAVVSAPGSTAKILESEIGAEGRRPSALQAPRHSLLIVGGASQGVRCCRGTRFVRADGNQPAARRSRHPRKISSNLLDDHYTGAARGSKRVDRSAPRVPRARWRDRGLQHGVRACRESDHHGPRLIAWTGGCILAPLALVIDVFAVTHLVAPSPFDHSLLPAGAPGAGDKP